LYFGRFYGNGSHFEKSTLKSNQGAKNVKFTPNFTNFCSNVSCHIHILWNEISQKKSESVGFVQPPQKLPHTTVDIPTKFHEV
jgi:hypothetical protein